jgi:hypothetical protein
MVISTTIVLGALMPWYIKVHLEREGRAAPADDNKSVIRDTLMMETSPAGESEKSKRYRTKLQNLVRRIDENYIKPFLIYNYALRKKEIERSKRQNVPQSDGPHEGRMTLNNDNSAGGHSNGGGRKSSDVGSRVS